MRLIDADELIEIAHEMIQEDTDAFNGGYSYDAVTVEEIYEAPTVEAVPKSYADQIRWERDIAIEQLNEIGCQFGQKMDEVKKKLEVLQWIPCSERLPEDTHEEYYQTVIMSLNDGRTTVGCYRNRDNEWWGDVKDGEYSDITGKVIAWQPLPEPYKGE